MNDTPLAKDKNTTVRSDHGRNWGGGAKLAISVILLAIVWIVLLPMFSRLPMVQEKMDAYDRADIDPYAVFYSDHPGMRDIERRMDSIVNGRDNAFWRLPEGMQSEN